MTKRIGILTSGGDCAGLNAAVRAVTLAAAARGHQVIGIGDGYTGLLNPAQHTQALNADTLDYAWLTTGGTFLGTFNKYYPHDFLMPDGKRADLTPKVIEGIKSLQLDGLVGIGGDGSMTMFAKLCATGHIPFIGIPKTMDKDIGLTETTIGFDTAVHVATTALEQLQPTARSHQRVMILEVMGRDAGHVALQAGIAGGADAILIPEIAYDYAQFSAHLRARVQHRQYALAVVSESIKAPDGQKFMQKHSNGDARYGGVAGALAAALVHDGVDCRAMVLGHLQRGAAPTPADRLLAAQLGVAAVDLFDQGGLGQMVGIKDGKVTSFAIADVVKTPALVDVNGPLVHSAKSMAIYVGSV
jgi:ATP-dependent phosphofructokinase / diphosphate-dependent phosphofructokinase